MTDACALHQGSRGLGQRSPQRLYFGARNQLLLSKRVAPMPPLPSLLRGTSIVGLNLAFALFRSKAPRLSGVGAVLRGVRDHLRHRYAEGTTPERPKA